MLLVYSVQALYSCTVLTGGPSHAGRWSVPGLCRDSSECRECRGRLCEMRDPGGGELCPHQWLSHSLTSQIGRHRHCQDQGNFGWYALATHASVGELWGTALICDSLIE